MLSAYIHIPFCVNKCPYCGFYSTHYDDQLAHSFLSALATEMTCRSSEFEDKQFGSVYIGGGTPTMLSLAQFSRLFDLVDEHFVRAADGECTIEANPNTVTAGTLSLLKARGVTRLSIGVQSFDDSVLVSLGRLHTANDALSAVRAARTAGFGNVGIDLIYGVPGQTEQQWQHTLESSLSLKPEHLSVYGLSLDDGSRLSCEVKAGRVTLPHEDVVARMYETATRCLAGAGYRQYEISNFCIPGKECRHNNNYWDRGEYAGFGPGAWSFIGNRRSATIANVSEYIARMKDGVNAVETTDVPDRDQAASETLFLGLRRTAGINLEHFEHLFGSGATNDLKKKISKLDGSGLFKIDDANLSLTIRGFLLSNEALAAILP
jgi:oxygen-independent coproporphyrinogen III oxidase